MRTPPRSRSLYRRDGGRDVQLTTGTWKFAAPPRAASRDFERKSAISRTGRAVYVPPQS